MSGLNRPLRLLRAVDPFADRMSAGSRIDLGWPSPHPWRIAPLSSTFAAASRWQFRACCLVRRTDLASIYIVLALISGGSCTISGWVLFPCRSITSFDLFIIPSNGAVHSAPPIRIRTRILLSDILFFLRFHPFIPHTFSVIYLDISAREPSQCPVSTSVHSVALSLSHCGYRQRVVCEHHPCLFPQQLSLSLCSSCSRGSPSKPAVLALSLSVPFIPYCLASSCNTRILPKSIITSVVSVITLTLLSVTLSICHYHIVGTETSAWSVRSRLESCTILLNPLPLPLPLPTFLAHRGRVTPCSYPLLTTYPYIYIYIFNAHTTY